jgi:pyridoxal 5'-phosphate synthase pdxS subunit
MMQLGAEAVFVGSGVFKSADPAVRARAIVQATTHFRDPDVLAKVSEELGDAMPGLETARLAEAERLQTRGW